MGTKGYDVMRDRTPIALFVYNRPQHVSALLKSLKACTRLDECQVFVFCDGPKKPEHLQDVTTARQVVHEFAESNHPLQIMERDENLGLARSIVLGVTELCEKYGRVIVLEDDFILHPFFLDFMLQSLDKYVDEESVAQVAGFTFPVNINSAQDAFFLPLTTTWGWATWQRAWRFYPGDVTDAMTELQNQQTRSAFDLDDAYPYSAMLKSNLGKRIDSWGIRWWWAIFKSRKLVLYPQHSLVWVGGFDDTGTNNRSNSRVKLPTLQDVLSHPWPGQFSFPDEIAVDQTAFEQVKRYLYAQKKSPGLFSRIRRFLKEKVSR
jgi:hypothetical protein